MSRVPGVFCEVLGIGLIFFSETKRGTNGINENKYYIVYVSAFYICHCIVVLILLISLLYLIFLGCSLVFTSSAHAVHNFVLSFNSLLITVALAPHSGHSYPTLSSFPHPLLISPCASIHLPFLSLPFPLSLRVLHLSTRSLPPLGLPFDPSPARARPACQVEA